MVYSLPIQRNRILYLLFVICTIDRSWARIKGSFYPGANLSLLRGRSLCLDDFLDYRLPVSANEFEEGRVDQYTHLFFD